MYFLSPEVSPDKRRKKLVKLFNRLSVCAAPQRLVSIPDLLSAIKLLCMRFQRELVTVVDDLRLDTLLRMLKTPHFSTKMNSLKEVGSRGGVPALAANLVLLSGPREL